MFWLVLLWLYFGECWMFFVSLEDGEEVVVGVGKC